jgi:hypothetical protein
MPERYWVIGGEYESTAFDKLVDGTEQMLGPYRDPADARRAWEHIAVETRSVCTARFTIVREGSAFA